MSHLLPLADDPAPERADAALVALPHKAAAPVVRALRERGLKVVDLSADFRLDREQYERWYQPHEAPDLLGEAVTRLPQLAVQASGGVTSLADLARLTTDGAILGRAMWEGMLNLTEALDASR